MLEVHSQEGVNQVDSGLGGVSQQWPAPGRKQALRISLYCGCLDSQFSTPVAPRMLAAPVYQLDPADTRRKNNKTESVSISFKV